MPGVKLNEETASRWRLREKSKGFFAARAPRHGKTWHLRERRFASFSRSFAFPGDVDADRAEAVFENGELRLTLPKNERAKPRQIRIGASREQPLSAPVSRKSK